MKVSRRLVAGALSLAALLGLPVPPAHAEMAAVRLKYGTLYSPTDFYEVPSKYFMEEVTKRSNGRITFEPYYGGSLLKARELSPGVSAGAVDIAVTVPGAFEPEQFPLTGVTLPFITSNVYAATAGFKALYASSPEMKKEFEKHNQTLLYAMGSGENSLWTNRAVRTAADLKGLRIRVTLGVADALAALGATPVGIPWSEALDLIQRGGVDGVSATPFDQGVKTGLADMIPFVSDAGGMGSYAAVTVVMNKGKWDRLAPEARKIIEEVAAEIPAYYVDKLDEEVDRMVDKLASSEKVTVIKTDEAEAKRWRDVAEPAVRAVWMKRAARAGVDPKAFLERYVSLVREKEAERSYVTGIDRYLKRSAQ